MMRSLSSEYYGLQQGVIKVLTGHRKAITSVMYRPGDGHLIASSRCIGLCLLRAVAAFPLTIRVLSMTTEKAHSLFALLACMVHSYSVLALHRRLIWITYTRLLKCSLSGDVLIHNTKDGMEPVNLSVPGCAPQLGLSFSLLDNALLASAANDGHLFFYDVNPRIMTQKLQAHQARQFAGLPSSLFRATELFSLPLMLLSSPPVQGPVAGLCFSATSCNVLYSVGEHDRFLATADMRLKVVNSQLKLRHQPSCLAARNDGVLLAIGCNGACIFACI